jgi:hypothetical protein
MKLKKDIIKINKKRGNGKKRLNGDKKKKNCS